MWLGQMQVTGKRPMLDVFMNNIASFFLIFGRTLECAASVALLLNLYMPEEWNWVHQTYSQNSSRELGPSKASGDSLLDGEWGYTARSTNPLSGLQSWPDSQLVRTRLTQPLVNNLAPPPLHRHQGFDFPGNNSKRINKFSNFYHPCHLFTSGSVSKVQFPGWILTITWTRLEEDGVWSHLWHSHSPRWSAQINPFIGVGQGGSGLRYGECYTFRTTTSYWEPVAHWSS